MAQLTLWTRLSGWFNKMILFCCEGVSRSSGEVVPLSSGEVVPLSAGESVPLSSGEGVPLSSSEGLPPAREGVPRATCSSKPPEWYMDRATECMDQVLRMSLESNSTSLKVYQRQCEYLARQLETAIKNSRESFDSSFPLERREECLDILKLLYRLAKEGESFIRDCCNKATWMQAALTRSAIVPVLVSSWGCQLKLCTELLRNSNKLGAAWLTVTELEDLGEADRDAVQEMASGDEDSLLRLLESPTSLPSKSSVLERDTKLATVLLQRSKAKASGGSTPSSCLEAWKVVDGEDFYSQELIGKGASASVYKAEWFGSMKVVLMRYYEEQNVDFLTEVDMHAGLAHPKIVSFLGFSTGEESCSIVLELMDGDLRALMEQRMQEDSTRDAPFNIWEACDIMLQVAEGVQYMHQNGVVHRDLKSSNILVKSSRDDDAEHVCAKVSDFGLSKRKDKSRTYSHQTLNVGTTRWMAPELIRPLRMLESSEGVLKHPFKSDVFSLGMLCYEILTGDIPFSNLLPNQVKERVLRGVRPELPSQCPLILKNLIELCWDPEPTTRPSSAEICEELGYIRCSLLLGTCPLEPLDQDNTEPALLVPFEAPVFPQEVSGFKGEYSAFKFLRQLGKGGSDFVTVNRSTWRLPNTDDQVDVAQKLFIGSHNQCFMNEVSIMADLEHRNVVRLLRYATDWRSCSIMMELMDEDLHDLMRRRRSEGNVTPTGPFSMDEAVHVILQIALGMEYVHEKNIVHRDLKSCNILVRKGTEGGQLKVKVADFGLSLKLASRGTLLDKDESGVGTPRWMAPEVSLKLASRGTLLDNEESGVGTPRWMAPEVTRLSKYDPFKSDVFSFGMLCYEILVGRVPFYKMENVDEVRTKVLAGERPTLPEWTLSWGLKDLVENCWQEEPHQRPSFTDIIKMLTQSRV